MLKKLKKLKENIKKKDEPANFDLNEDSYIELQEKPTEKQAKIYVRYCVLDAFEDVKPILDFVREGSSICLIKIKALRSKDISELKRAISKIKKVCEVMDGNVVGMDEDYLIASPSFVKVFKGFGKEK
jgi:SepF-like predicted cell division protein (DUF552 family)